MYKGRKWKKKSFSPPFMFESWRKKNVTEENHLPKDAIVVRAQSLEGNLLSHLKSKGTSSFFIHRKFLHADNSILGHIRVQRFFFQKTTKRRLWLYTVFKGVFTQTDAGGLRERCMTLALIVAPLHGHLFRDNPALLIANRRHEMGIFMHCNITYVHAHIRLNLVLLSIKIWWVVPIL